MTTRTIQLVTYGIGGFDTTKPNNNILSVETVPEPLFTGSVNMTRLKIALSNQGNFDTIENSISGSATYKIMWASDMQVAINSEFAQYLATELALGNYDLSDLFTAASQL